MSKSFLTALVSLMDKWDCEDGADRVNFIAHRGQIEPDISDCLVRWTENEINMNEPSLSWDAVGRLFKSLEGIVPADVNQNFSAISNDAARHIASRLTEMDALVGSLFHENSSIAKRLTPYVH